MNARSAHLIHKDCQRIIACLAVNGGKTRAVTAVVKRLLLNAPYFHDGIRVDPVAKSLGAGVWELRNRTEESQ